MSNTYDLFGKELLTRIGLSAFPHMGSLVLNYIHVGTSTQLLYLFRNVNNGTSAFPHMGSLVLNYIHVGTSTQLLYLFRNVNIGTSA